VGITILCSRRTFFSKQGFELRTLSYYKLCSISQNIPTCQAQKNKRLTKRFVLFHIDLCSCLAAASFTGSVISSHWRTSVGCCSKLVTRTAVYNAQLSHRSFLTLGRRDQISGRALCRPNKTAHGCCLLY